MSDKMYPDVDHMALGQRYCDHVLAMTVETLHDKSDIAAQLAWRDARIAAKDADISAALVTVQELADQFDALRAAKDAEIAELRQQRNEASVLQLRAMQERDMTQSLLDEWRQRVHQAESRIVECEEAVDQAVELAEYLEGHSKGAMAERVKTALSAKFARERKALRNEALECVRRLYQWAAGHQHCCN